MAMRQRCPKCRVFRRPERFLPLVDECEACILDGYERMAVAWAKAGGATSGIRIDGPFTSTSISAADPQWQVIYRRVP